MSDMMSPLSLIQYLEVSHDRFTIKYIYCVNRQKVPTPKMHDLDIGSGLSFRIVNVLISVKVTVRERERQRDRYNRRPYDSSLGESSLAKTAMLKTF